MSPDYRTLLVRWLRTQLAKTAEPDRDLAVLLRIAEREPLVIRDADRDALHHMLVRRRRFDATRDLIVHDAAQLLLGVAGDSPRSRTSSS